MKLLIDAGNSRVKWALYEGSLCRAQGAVVHDEVGALAAEWANWPITAGWASSVAKPALRRALDAASPVALCWVAAQRAGAGVCNHYRDVAEQGADRWLAVLAARRLGAGDVIVACAGTALTVEALTAAGDYLGGLILPGRQLMLHSLARGTAQLDRAAGLFAAFPQGTEDAIASGVVDAHAGAVERLRRRLEQHSGHGQVEVWLTGGDASHLLPHIAAPVRIVDNLVILGLLTIADAS